MRHLLFLLLCLPLPAIAQQADSLAVPEAPLDTSPVYWITAGAPEERRRFEDTLLDYSFRMYDPARRSPWADLGTLGLYGSPARPLLFGVNPKKGFAYADDVFDLYRLDPENLRFFKHSRTFSRAGFNMGRTQNDNAVTALLARTFGGGATAALEYRSSLNVGQYRYQSVRNNAFSVGFHLPAGRRYEGFLAYTVNSNRQQENGGLAEGAVFGGGQFSGPINAPIQLPTQTAQSRYANRNLLYTQHFRFSGKKAERQFRATHNIRYAEESYKFAHPNPGADTLFYDTFMVDRRGIRQYTEVRRIDNQFQLGTYRNRGEGLVADVLSAGILFNHIRVRQEPGDSIIQNWFLTGRFAFSPSERFRATLDGALGILDNLGEYQASGRLRWDAGRFGTLEAGLLSQRYPPPMLFHRLNVSGRPFWDNDFEKPVETMLWGAYRLPTALPVQVFTRLVLVNNYLYFDTLGLARQTGEPLQLVQFGASVQLRWRFLRLEETFCLQQNNRDDVLRLPNWFSRSALFAEGRIFQKRLFFQAGFDFRTHGAFRPDAWHPLTGQFRLNDNLQQEPYPWLDAFVVFNIQTFRFFFRYENLGTLLWNDEATYQQSARHPHLFHSFRFGFDWRFLD